MQTFSKSLRNALPAIGLGLLSVVGLASVALAAAPAAMAQIKAKKEFVDNYNAANAANTAKDYQTAIDKANAAEPFAGDDQQRCVLAQIRTSAYYGLKKNQEVITNAEKAISLGCITGDQLKNYKQMLAGAYAGFGNEAKALELTKSFIDEYGGDSTQYGFLAKRAYDGGNYDDALKYGQKALDQVAKEGKKPLEAYFNIVINANLKKQNMDAYYDSLMRAATILNKPEYWRPLILRAVQEPKYKKQEGQADVLRTLQAANITLTPDEQHDLGEQAYNRGSAVEAEKVLAPLFQSGALGGAADPQADRNKRLFASVQTDAKADKAGGLAQTEKEAATKPTGEVFVSVGEAYMGAGDFAKAIDQFQKGLAKGQMEPGATDFAKLRLGMAQYKSGAKDDARKTWAEVKADNGSGWLAKVWTALSQVQG